MKPKTRLLTQSRLKSLLNYDPQTGVFIWKINKNNAKKGDTAGHISVLGYSIIKIDGVSHQSHRLVFLYQKGYLPEKGIDHINRMRHDNREINLREASHQCNNRNSGNPCDNTSGVKGVTWTSTRGKWQA